MLIFITFIVTLKLYALSIITFEKISPPRSINMYSTMHEEMLGLSTIILPKFNKSA